MTHPRLYKIHKWLGVGLFILFLLQGTTGLILANKYRLMDLEMGTALPAETGTQDPSLDTTITALKRLYPNYHLDRVIFPPEISRPLIVRMKNKASFWQKIVYLHPVTHMPVSHGPEWQYAPQLAERLHLSLLSGTAGRVILAIEGLVLCFMCVSGLLVWWPRNGALLRGLKITRNLGPQRLIRDMHVVPAVLLSPFLLVIGLTGFLIIAEPLVKPVIGLFAATGTGLKLDIEPLEPPRELPSWQTSFEQLKTNYPTDRIGQLRFVGEDRLLGAVVYTGGHSNPRAHHIAAVDRYSGKLFVLETAGTGPAGDAIINWFVPIHAGDIYGPFRAPIQSLFGIMLVALAVTAIIMWQSRRPSHPQS